MSEGLGSEAGGGQGLDDRSPGHSRPAIKIDHKANANIAPYSNEPFVNAQFGFNLFIFNYGSPHSIFTL